MRAAVSELRALDNPMHIHEHAVVFNGLEPHSSGKFNGDRWSLSYDSAINPGGLSHIIWQTIKWIGVAVPTDVTDVETYAGRSACPSDDSPRASLPQEGAFRTAGKTAPTAPFQPPGTP